MPTTATIEVLTAKVQVLMVGSRQITKSVWAQLDWVLPNDLDPMGRVEPETTSERCSIIGAAKWDGSLVRALVRGAEWHPFPDAPYRDDEHMRITKDEWVQRMATLRIAKALPLIVLAGLR